MRKGGWNILDEKKAILQLRVKANNCKETSFCVFMNGFPGM